MCSKERKQLGPGTADGAPLLDKSPTGDMLISVGLTVTPWSRNSLVLSWEPCMQA